MGNGKTRTYWQLSPYLVQGAIKCKLDFGRQLLAVVKSESAAAATVGGNLVVPSFLEEKAAGILAGRIALQVKIEL